MLKPEEMEKVRIIGTKKQLEPAIEKLYEMEVLHFENGDYSLENGDPYPVAEEISELLVRTRSIISKLPKLGEKDVDKDKGIDELERAVEEKYQRIESIEKDIQIKKKNIEVLEKLQGVVPEELIESFEKLEIIAGEVEERGLEEEFDREGIELFTEDSFVVLFVKKGLEKEVLKDLRKYGFERTDISDVLEVKDYSKKLEENKSDIEELEKEKTRLEEELEELGSEYGGFLEKNRDDFEEKLEKSEAPMKFMTTDSAFIGEGWIPSDRFEELKEELKNTLENKVFIEKLEEDKEDAPIQYDHTGFMKNFEPLLEMYSPPKYTEIDPTFVLAMTFPIFYGMMLSDFGYGLLTFFLFVGLRRWKSEFKHMMNMMIYASISTVFFGLLGGSAFGVTFLGPESAIGIEFLQQIPVLLDFQADVMTIMGISLIMGAVQLNLGFLIGFYNDLSNRGIGSAVLRKGSWFVFQLGLVLVGTNYLGYTAMSNYVPGLLVAAGSAMYLKGRGPMGSMDLILFVTDILSYIRLMALGIATVSIAMVVNLIAGALFGIGPVGILFGVLVLIGGHLFNIAFQVLGSSLHSLRLNFVEFFDKFYEGGGEKFKPFGNTK